MGRSRVQGKHAGLTRDQVLQAAVRLVDRDGVEALSMRKLARELDVEAMTLYHHVENKRGLEDAIVEYVLAESLDPPRESASWQEIIASHAHELDRGLARHPGAVILFATRPANTTRNLATVENLLRILHDAGFAPRTALHVVHAVAAAVVGNRLGYAADQSKQLDGAVDLAIEGLPLLSAAYGEGPVTIETRLQFTLTALIAGFETLLEGP
ncbi:TetR/AcrR family transcriptional regulator C-terminal domain-containing protein [Jiangella gansuensis]|uniref:TetR/AcrR family transcriptional regulator C-terminal domain-containing protein n=1 Tax=Jiangella gansuensis TaxID=281473 RepID=UPI0004B46B15|nr:TetR/AcrR family transcriptional regulator C-terminal domain-containing protein [Jiangella gansuensis]